MSHHSRLSNLVIDCKVDDLAAAAEFWSRALGKKIASPDQDGDGKYAELESRVHLDIETDDLEAEVARLEALGARRVEFRHRWWVMEAPTGHRFCIVNRQRDAFGPHLNTWHD